MFLKKESVIQVYVLLKSSACFDKCIELLPDLYATNYTFGPLLLLLVNEMPTCSCIVKSFNNLAFSQQINCFAQFCNRHTFMYNKLGNDSFRPVMLPFRVSVSVLLTMRLLQYCLHIKTLSG